MLLEKIEAERKLRGWSKYRLARNAGLNPQRVYVYLRTGRASLRSVEALMKALGMNL